MSTQAVLATMLLKQAGGMDKVLSFFGKKTPEQKAMGTVNQALRVPGQVAGSVGNAVDELNRILTYSKQRGIPELTRERAQQQITKEKPAVAQELQRVLQTPAGRSDTDRYERRQHLMSLQSRLQSMISPDVLRGRTARELSGETDKQDPGRAAVGRTFPSGYIRDVLMPQERTQPSFMQRLRGVKPEIPYDSRDMEPQGRATADYIKANPEIMKGITAPFQKEQSQQGVHTMNPKLQAGIELTIEKTAAREMGVGLLSSTLNQKLARLGKKAEDQGVQVTSAGGAGSPSSNTSQGMEDKNKGFGKGKEKLDDDPTKGGQETGAVMSAHAGKNITTESSGMKDLSLKQGSLSPNAKVLATMIRAVA